MPQIYLSDGKKAPKKRLSAEERKKQFERDHKKVRGVFRFMESPGGTLRFAFRKYKEDPVWHFELKDGEVCELPLMVARHLSQNCSYPIYKHRKDPVETYEQANPLALVDRMEKRCTFESIDFLVDAEVS